MNISPCGFSRLGQACPARMSVEQAVVSCAIPLYSGHALLPSYRAKMMSRWLWYIRSCSSQVHAQAVRSCSRHVGRQRLPPICSKLSLFHGAVVFRQLKPSGGAIPLAAPMFKICSRLWCACRNRPAHLPFRGGNIDPCYSLDMTRCMYWPMVKKRLFIAVYPSL